MGRKKQKDDESDAHPVERFGPLSASVHVFPPSVVL